MERVKAIRENKKIGTGTCSSIDECWSDDDLVSALDREGITNVSDALEWALKQEGLWLEQGLNARWGDDDDPELKNYNEFFFAGPEM